MTTYDQLPDGAMFVRPDTVNPHRVYVRRDARMYRDMDGWWNGRDADEPPIDCKADVTAHGLALDTIRDELAQREGPGYDPLSVLVRRESVDVLPGGRVAVQYGERSA